MEDKTVYRKAFSENLKKIRKQSNLTQEQFANKIGYSTKAVSKWECGIAIPPTETLIDIADNLNVRLDDLLAYDVPPTYYLGIDGGATKTCFVLVDSNGELVNKVVLPSSNPFDLGFEKSFEILDQGITQVIKTIPKRKISVFAGISGGISGNAKEKFREFFSKYGFAKVDNGSDVENIVYASLNDCDGLALVLGTGCAGFIKKGETLSRIGGLGYLFDHGGSGYDMGCQAIRSACRAEDMTGEPTILRDMILQKLNTKTILENLSYFYQIGKSGIASYSTLVVDAFKQGDKVAKEIVESNMKHVAHLIVTARKRLDNINPLKVVMVGGLTNESQMILPIINKYLDDMDSSNNYHLQVYGKNVVYGALIRAGMKPNGNEY